MKFFENIRRMMEFSSGRNVFLFGRMDYHPADGTIRPKSQNTFVWADWYQPLDGTIRRKSQNPVDGTIQRMKWPDEPNGL
jgi:hypothetical protein